MLEYPSRLFLPATAVLLVTANIVLRWLAADAPSARGGPRDPEGNPPDPGGTMWISVMDVTRDR